jgi:hypothetical protein
MAKRIIKRDAPSPPADGTSPRRTRKPKPAAEPVAITEDRWKHHPHGPIPLTQDVYDAFMSWCPRLSRPLLEDTRPYSPLKAKVGLRLNTTTRVVSDLCRETGSKGVTVFEDMCIRLGPYSEDHFLLCAILTHLGHKTPQPHIFRRLIQASTSPRCLLDPQGSPDAWGIAKERVSAALDAHRQVTMAAWRTGALETSQLMFYSEHFSLCRKTDELEGLRKSLRLSHADDARHDLRRQIATVEAERGELTNRIIDRLGTNPTISCRRLCEINWCVGDLP